MRLFLIRHPRPAIPPGICYGASDVPLAEPAAASAARLAPQLPAGARVISSPLRRCLDLARCLAPELASEVSVDYRLAEMNFGDWEGRSWDDIPRTEIDAWAADPVRFTPPGGESARALLNRALAFVDDLTGEGDDDAIVVTHGGVIRALLAHWNQLPDDQWADIRVEFASVTCASLGDGDGDTRRANTSAIVAPC
jgi:alpha-ribazole phosphatase